MPATIAPLSIQEMVPDDKYYAQDQKDFFKNIYKLEKKNKGLWVPCLKVCMVYYHQMMCKKAQILFG